MRCLILTAPRDGGDLRHFFPKKTAATSALPAGVAPFFSMELCLQQRGCVVCSSADVLFAAARMCCLQQRGCCLQQRDYFGGCVVRRMR
jgi:hypothetical protein